MSVFVLHRIQLGMCFTELIHISQRFVEGVLSFYYKSDTEVKNDSELQKWISEIFEYGFLSKPETGGL